MVLNIIAKRSFEEKLTVVIELINQDVLLEIPGKFRDFLDQFPPELQERIKLHYQTTADSLHFSFEELNDRFYNYYDDLDDNLEYNLEGQDLIENAYSDSQTPTDDDNSESSNSDEGTQSDNDSDDSGDSEEDITFGINEIGEIGMVNIYISIYICIFFILLILQIATAARGFNNALHRNLLVFFSERTTSVQALGKTMKMFTCHLEESKAVEMIQTTLSDAGWILGADFEAFWSLFPLSLRTLANPPRASDRSDDESSDESSYTTRNCRNRKLSTSSEFLNGPNITMRLNEVIKKWS